MPQRAVLNEDTNVLAYATDEEGWAGLTAAYKGGKLHLPCCGHLAIPKENVHGTRYFSHPPYKRIQCDRKDVSAKHESLVACIASELSNSKWTVTPEGRIHNTTVDILCAHSQFNIHAAIMIELKDREGIETEEYALKTSGIPCLWVFSARHPVNLNGLQDSYKLPNKSSNHATARYVKSYLLALEKAYEITESISNSLEDSTLSISVGSPRGMPTHYDLHDSLLGFTTSLKLDTEKNQLLFEESSFSKLSSADRERCIKQFRMRLEEGIDLWWPGYPELHQDTFKPLADHIAKTTKDRSEVILALSEHSYKYRRRPAALDPDSNNFSHELLNWGKARLKDVRIIASKVMDETEVDAWLNTYFDELDGLTPTELTYQSSDAIRRIEVFLGLRDPITNRPLKPDAQS